MFSLYLSVFSLFSYSPFSTLNSDILKTWIIYPSFWLLKLEKYPEFLKVFSDLAPLNTFYPTNIASSFLILRFLHELSPLFGLLLLLNYHSVGSLQLLGLSSDNTSSERLTLASFISFLIDDHYLKFPLFFLLSLIAPPHSQNDLFYEDKDFIHLVYCHIPSA